VIVLAVVCGLAGFAAAKLTETKCSCYIMQIPKAYDTTLAGMADRREVQWVPIEFGPKVDPMWCVPSDIAERLP